MEQQRSPNEAAAPIESPVIGIPSGDAVKVDLDAVRRSCEAVIAHRPGDASIPRVVISADILLAVVSHVERVRHAVGDDSLSRRFVIDLVERGPVVEGPGAADAAGEVIVDSRTPGCWMMPADDTGESGTAEIALMTDERVRDARTKFREEIERFVGLAHDCDDILKYGESVRVQRLADCHARVIAAMAKLTGGAP